MNYGNIIVSPTVSRAPAHLIFIIHASYQDNSSRHVLTEVEGTKRLAGPLSLCQPNKVQQLYCRPVRSQQWPRCPAFLLHPVAPPVLVFPLLSIYPTQTSTTFHLWELRGVGQVLLSQAQTKQIPLICGLWSCSPLSPLQYAQGPLLDNLYWTKWYNNESLAAHGTQSYIYYENLLLGVPRMRQLKVKNNSCVVHDDFKEEISGCYDVYSEDKEEKVSFGLINGTA